MPVDATGVKTDGALLLEYDSATGDIYASIGGLDNADSILAALQSVRIGTASFKNDDGKVYDLYSTGASSVVFAREESDCIRTVTMTGNGNTYPTFGTIPLAGGGSPFEIPITSDGQGGYTTTATAQDIYDNADNCVIVLGPMEYKPTNYRKDAANESATIIFANTVKTINNALNFMGLRIYAQLSPDQVTVTVSNDSSPQLPAVTSDDNGKFLRVANGAWAAASVPFQTPRVAMTASDTTPALDPNKLYVFPEMATLAPTLATPTDNAIVNEYHFIFTSGATATTLTIPASVRQPDGFTVDANHVYEVSILENCMTAQGWAVSAE